MLIVIFCIFLMQGYVEGKGKVLIVYAHQEPKSFCGAMRDTAVKTLEAEGHEVKVTDLYKMKMFNRLDKTDYTELYDNDYFRPQVEQLNANKHNRTNCIKELRDEHEKADWADIFLFIYPYYLSYIPGITHSWLERVFSYGFAFGEGGTHLKGKKAMLIYTTGGAKEWVSKYEKKMLFLLHDRIAFWGMKALEPFAAYHCAYVDPKVREQYLKDLQAKLKELP